MHACVCVCRKSLSHHWAGSRWTVTLTSSKRIRGTWWWYRREWIAISNRGPLKKSSHGAAMSSCPCANRSHRSWTGTFRSCDLWHWFFWLLWGQSTTLRLPKEQLSSPGTIIKRKSQINSIIIFEFTCDLHAILQTSMLEIYFAHIMRKGTSKRPKSIIDLWKH